MLDRGFRREPIFKDEADRRRFLETWVEVCARTRWRVHAYVLMSNQYHLVNETPAPNIWWRDAAAADDGDDAHRQLGI